MASPDFMKALDVSIRSSWDAYRQVWKQFLPFAVLGVAVGLASYVAMFVYQMYFAQAPLEASLIFVLVFLVLVAVLSYLQMVLEFAIISAANDIHAGKMYPVTYYFQQNLAGAGAYYIFSILLTAVFFGVIVAAALLGGGISLAALTNALQGGDVSSALGTALMGAGVAIVLTLIPLLIVAVVFGFFTQFMQVEMAAGKQGLVEALKSSFSLVRGNLVFVFAMGLLLWIIFGVISIPQGIIGVPYSILSDSDFSALLEAMIPAALVTLLTAICFIPAAAAGYIFTMPLTNMIWVKYWRILKGTDRI